MKLVERFLVELSQRWREPTRPQLRIIGSAALMLQTSHVRATKDSDILETIELDADTKDRLIAIAGPRSELAIQWKMYLDIVSSGLPFLPHTPIWHPVTIPGASNAIMFDTLDVADVVVSKLKRFAANDRSDIGAMIDLELVSHSVLVERFLSAVDVFACDARAADLPRYVENLHEVERDMFGVDETIIELPDWC